MRAPSLALTLLLSLASTGPARATSTTAGAELQPTALEDSYRARVRAVLEERSSMVDTRATDTGGLADVAVKLALCQDAAWCSRRLTTLMAEPTGDMFWMFPCVAIAALGEDLLDEPSRLAMRDAWRNYMPMRGDTENHWAMYYTSLYLMAERWPAETGDRWFTGKSSEENLREARDYLLHWIDLTTRRGQGEYDCTHYIGEYCIPMLYLATWARDRDMRKRGQMMLDYILADFAVDTLEGIYVGAHARTDDIQVVEKWNGLSSFFAWLFFDACPRPDRNTGFQAFFAAAAHVSSYRVPEVVRLIATRRHGPYLQRERKRTRNRWRNTTELHLPVFKQTYMTSVYAVGSDGGGDIGLIQHHSWDVTWTVPDPRGVHNTLFAMHPSTSTATLQTYLAEFPDWLPYAVTSQGKPTFLNGDKLLGGSPAEQVFQDRDTIVALYDISPSETFGHINAFFSRDLARIEEDASGWVFAQGGQAFMACRPLRPFVWRPLPGGDRLMQIPGRRNGFILQVARADEFSSWEEFKKAICRIAVDVDLESTPRVSFVSLRGSHLTCVHGEELRVNHRRVDASLVKLFEGPFLNADLDSGRLEMTYGGRRRVLDFTALEISDERIINQPRP